MARKLSMKDAINEAIDQEMRRDPTVIVMGEDIVGGTGSPGEADAWGGVLGVTKGLLTCHLGLIVPRDGDVRMRVKNRTVRWAEGETLMFDDTYDHEVWNDASATRVVLLIQVRRPLRQPGKWVADAFLGVVRRSAFVQEARANVLRWNQAMKALDV